MLTATIERRRNPASAIVFPVGRIDSERGVQPTETGDRVESEADSAEAGEQRGSATAGTRGGHRHDRKHGRERRPEEPITTANVSFECHTSRNAPR